MFYRLRKISLAPTTFATYKHTSWPRKRSWDDIREGDACSEREREIKKAIRPFRFLLSPSRVLTKINGVPALECSQRVANEFYTRDIRVSPSYPPIPLSRGSILSVPRTGKKWNDNEIIEVYIHNRVCFDGHPDDGRGVDA